MADRPHVALIVETSIHYGRQVLQGITRYVRSHQPRSCVLKQRVQWASAPAWLQGWRGGIICRKTTPERAKMLPQAGIPVVDLSDIYPSFGVPRIESDHNAIGSVAADHLLERGFTQFGFCGFSDQNWSSRRRQGYIARLAERGLQCDVWESPWPEPRAHPWEREQEHVSGWLQSLGRPAGLMACNDMHGQYLLDAYQRADVAVAEEAAVIGVDDDAVLCHLCHPPLLSVVTNAERVGYEAAALLDAMMAGNKPPTMPMLSAPTVVTTRQSSDMLAIDDR